MKEHILKIIHAVSNMEDITLRESFNKVLSYISVNSLSGAEASVELKTETMLFLDDQINIDEIKAQREDVLGYCYKNIYNANKKELNDSVNYDTLIGQILKKNFPTPVFMKEIDTGEFALKMKEMVDNRAIIYGASKDIIIYRIAVLNVHLFNLPLFALYIEPSAKTSSIDLRTCSPNWQYANRWNPTKTSLLSKL